MFVNILHRPEHGPLYAIYRMQQEMAHAAGLPVTVFLHYRDLFDETILADAHRDAEIHADELGLTLHRLSGPGLDTGGCDQFWLLPLDQKRTVLETIVRRWRALFGGDPRCVASYHFDASALRILREVAPGVETVVGGCFEEGVRVFHGCNHSWYLFNEGMPWGPWMPSKTHALRPACDAEDWSGVVAVPHLARDMSLSYEGRNDFWATHPPNVVRGMGNVATWSPYDLNLVDQYRLQDRYNPLPGYINAFVGPSWLSWNHNSEYPPEVSQELYLKQLNYLAGLRAEGAVTVTTLGDYGRWFRAHRTEPQREVYWARELLYGSAKHYVWYLDAACRVVVDCSQGGSIGDLRPYVGRVAVETGPEAPRKMIGSYPYLIQSQHRTGVAHHYTDGSRTTAFISRAGETVDLATVKVRCAGIERRGEGVVATLEPARVRFRDGSTVDVVTTFTFAGGGHIGVSRALSGAVDGVVLREVVKATWGYTEYPEPLDTVELRVGDQSLRYAYRGRRIEAAARGVSATVPEVGTVLELAAGDDGHTSTFRAAEGHLFNPYYTLERSCELRSGETAVTWINLKPIAS